LSLLKLRRYVAGGFDAGRDREFGTSSLSTDGSYGGGICKKGRNSPRLPEFVKNLLPVGTFPSCRIKQVRKLN
jgi:hypothetical protein